MHKIHNTFLIQVSKYIVETWMPNFGPTFKLKVRNNDGGSRIMMKNGNETFQSVWPKYHFTNEVKQFCAGMIDPLGLQMKSFQLSRQSVFLSLNSLFWNIFVTVLHLCPPVHFVGKSKRQESSL